MTAFDSVRLGNKVSHNPYQAIASMDIKLPKKVGDKWLDENIHAIHVNQLANPSDEYHFDLTDVEFVANQELLVLSALWKSFYSAGIKFRVEFIRAGTPIDTKQLDEGKRRVFRQIIQFWDVWKVWSVVPPERIRDYFGFDGALVDGLKSELGYYPRLSEIYTRNGITPFVSLDFINNYNESGVQELIKPIYRLNSVIEELLSRNRCHHPFTSNSLSTIITEELYLNFLDHSSPPSYPSFPQSAFMSISLQTKIDDAKHSPKEIQRIKDLNFRTECLGETVDFFYDGIAKRYKNDPYIQFSFLDFGQGIAKSLEREFHKKQTKLGGRNNDSDILRYAFNHDTSRHSLYKLDRFIPRGLFDALAIVKRYNGVLIARSNFGKILFDFSLQSDIEKACSHFGSGNHYFPGTLLTVYIPAIEDSTKLDITSIKPELTFAKVKPGNKKYVTLNAIAEAVKGEKEKIYETLLRNLREAICHDREPSLVFVSFKACELDKRIVKKVIYFLLTDHDINYRHNVVILHTPPYDLVQEIASELLVLNSALRNYRLHPLPIVDFDNKAEAINVTWLGIYDAEDREKLIALLDDQYTLARSDFRDPGNISGQLNEFDSYGNLISNFPNRNDIVSFYRSENELYVSAQVNGLLGKYNCIKKDDSKNLYLCNSNYYQKEYIDLNNLVNDKVDCNAVTQMLYDRVCRSLGTTEGYQFIGISSTSHKLLKSLESQGLILEGQSVILDNHHAFERDLSSATIDATKKHILICDVISTGDLTQRLNDRLVKLSTSIEHIAVVVSVLDPDFSSSRSFLQMFEGKIISLYHHPIKKYLRGEIGAELSSKTIIRINPHTSIPITLSIGETNFDDSVIYHSSADYDDLTNSITIKNPFLDWVKEDHLNVGFLEFNNVIHPYFFNTEAILREAGETLLRHIFKRIPNANLSRDPVKVFYPKQSAIESFNFGYLRSVLNNYSIEEIEIERFGTSEGWRFPHNTDYLNARINKDVCLILDDGSCSGDSLIQMIDEISFYDVKEIVLVCVIGRVNDHKREFFSRVTSIRVKNGSSIPISIYFASHWHIPTYYVDDNPTTRELRWLDDVISLQNTPQRIRNIATNVRRAITPTNRVSFRDYKYLPRVKGSNLIPKKDLMLVREEVGKVIGYRPYKESFKFFDCLMRKYEKKVQSKDRYREIELLCATFVYEPYLYDKIQRVLPDVVVKIEEFVRALIFSDKQLYRDLTFVWDKRDLVHLFFIVFKNEKLIKELDADRLTKLIAFTDTNISTLNYVLYKLLSYFATRDIQLKDKQYDSSMRDLLVRLMEKDSSMRKAIKQYYNFISTLPAREDFDSQLRVLRENYSKQGQPQSHIDKKSFDHNISYMLALIREIMNSIEARRSIEQSTIVLIRECWFEILDFINPILSFSSRFKEFLSPYPYFELVNRIENGNNSLRALVGFNEDVLLVLNESYNDIDKLKLIEAHMMKIQLAVGVESVFCQLIIKHTCNLHTLLHNITKAMEGLRMNCEVRGSELVLPNYIVSVPEIYADILIEKELTTNMNNHSKKSPDSSVLIEYSMPNESFIQMKISNTISDQTPNNSNGEGIKCLNLLSGSDLFGFRYSSAIHAFTFIQTLTFKVL